MSLLRRHRPATTGAGGGGCAPQFKPFVLPVKAAAARPTNPSSDADDAARNRKALLSGADLALKRLPFLSFLSVPPEVTTHKLRQQFKSPGAARSSESDRLLQVKTLGMRRRWGAFVPKDPVRHALPLLVVDEDDDNYSGGLGDAAVAEPLPAIAAPAAADAPPPLVLWQSEEDPAWQVVVPEIVGKFLRPHQREGVQFMFDCTSMAPDRQPAVKRAVVVCPTSLVKNWDDEIVKWLHGRVKTVALFEANRDAVVKGIRAFVDGSRNPRPGAPQVLVISYETFRMHAQRFVDAPSACDLLICDEAHRLKNAGSQINRALSALACSARLCEVVNQFILRRGNILNAKHLPPKLMQVVCCPLSPLQEQLYAHFLASSAFRDLMKKQNANVLASITALKKLCNHPLLIFDETGKSNTKLPGFDNCAHFFAQALQGGGGTSAGAAGAGGAFNRRGGPMHRTCHPAWSGKMLLLDRLMQSMKSSTTDRIVIVSNYTQTLDVVSDLCRERHLPFVRLDGTTSAKKRKSLVDTFNDPATNSFAFLLSSKAGGCGLNLIGANRLVLFDPDWNPATDKQAAARVWREGQKKMCYVYRFLATGTLEEKIFQRQLSKEGLQNIVDDKEEVNSLSSKDLKRLFVFERDTMSTTHDQLKCGRCKWRNRSLTAIDSNADDVVAVDTTDDSDGDASASTATEKEASGDEQRDADGDDDSECSAEKTYHPQIGMPPEEDLNSWGHHRSYDSVDDEVMQNALKHVRADLVSFAFSCRIDWQLLQEHQAENEERETQRDEERKRKRLEKLEADKAREAGAAAAPKGRGKKKPTVIDEDSDVFSGSSSEEEEVVDEDEDEEEEEEEEENNDDSGRHTKRQGSEDDTTTDDVAETESEIEIIDVDAPARERPKPSALKASSPAKDGAMHKRKVSFIQQDTAETSSSAAQPATGSKRLKSMQAEDDFDDFDDPAPVATAKPAPPARVASSSIIDEDEKESEPPAASCAKSAPDDDAWSCSRCTLENPLANDMCSGCGLRFRRSRRPAAPVFDWNSDDDDF
ncbi:hypothetical protein PybrP1_007912 [[Pythium] brassicae (nom. inval.)]|nr:hypothetical protein PybrP1_007912 [[Pythium] brassicae (nom. inval.)]